MVQGPLKFGEDLLAWSVGGESRNKVGVVNKTEAHEVQLLFGDGQQEVCAVSSSSHHV